MGTQHPSPKRGRAPQFSAHVYCGQTTAWIKMVVGIEVGVSPRDFMLYGDPAPPQKGAEPPPQFSAHFYYEQTAGCIKMPLSLEVGISPGDFVLDGDPAPFPKSGPPKKNFDPYLLWPNGWMDQDGTWHGSRPQPRRLCVRWGPSLPPKQRGRSPLPNFRPISIAAKRLDASRCHLAWR